MGSILVIVGAGLMLIGGIKFIIAAFSESIIWGLACIFLPIASLLFLLGHWEEAKDGFLLQIAGAGVIILSVVIFGGERHVFAKPLDNRPRIAFVHTHGRI